MRWERSSVISAAAHRNADQLQPFIPKKGLPDSNFALVRGDIVRAHFPPLKESLHAPRSEGIIASK